MSSPSWTVSKPSKTKKESSNVVWKCNGGPAPYARCSNYQEVKASLVVTPIRFPSPAWHVPQCIPFHGLAFHSCERPGDT